MRTDDDDRRGRAHEDGPVGVGTDGSLGGPEEEVTGRRTGRRGGTGDGVGTDGSLDGGDEHVERELVDRSEVTDPEYTDRRTDG